LFFSIIAVEGAYGNYIDHGQIIKMYGTESGGEKRYSPSKFVSSHCSSVTGNPEKEHIPTSYNFGKIHKNLREMPAMETGILYHVWELEEIAALSDSNWT